jgi:hypothetical protein
MKHLFNIGLVAALLLAGCAKEEQPAPVDLGYDYFPAKVGAWVVFQVDSLWQDDVAGVLDSVSYLLREQVVEQYTDVEGRTAYRLVRSVQDVEGNWVPRDVWTFTVNSTAAELTEENKRRLKLSFPVRETRSWDLNALNTDDELLVAFRNVGQPWSSGGNTYGETVLVRNTLPPNLVVIRNFEERYAKGVGLVSKYWEEMNRQTTYPPNQPPVVRVVGFRLNMLALDHGTE